VAVCRGFVNGTACQRLSPAPATTPQATQSWTFSASSGDGFASPLDVLSLPGQYLVGGDRRESVEIVIGVVILRGRLQSWQALAGADLTEYPAGGEPRLSDGGIEIRSDGPFRAPTPGRPAP